MNRIPSGSGNAAFGRPQRSQSRKAHSVGGALRRIVVLLGSLALAGSIFSIYAGSSSAANAPTTTAPFNECPGVGNDSGCRVPHHPQPGRRSGDDRVKSEHRPFDGEDDTLVGIFNNSGAAVSTIGLSSNTDIFGFDGDGICGTDDTHMHYTWVGTGLNGFGFAGCPYGTTGYEGPWVSYSNYLEVEQVRNGQRQLLGAGRQWWLHRAALWFDDVLQSREQFERCELHGPDHDDDVAIDDDDVPTTTTHVDNVNDCRRTVNHATQRRQRPSRDDDDHRGRQRQRPRRRRRPPWRQRQRPRAPGSTTTLPPPPAITVPTSTTHRRRPPTTRADDHDDCAADHDDHRHCHPADRPTSPPTTCTEHSASDCSVGGSGYRCWWCGNVVGQRSSVDREWNVTVCRPRRIGAHCSSPTSRLT